MCQHLNNLANRTHIFFQILIEDSKYFKQACNCNQQTIHLHYNRNFLLILDQLLPVQHLNSAFFPLAL
jgi:hypothetical protein